MEKYNSKDQLADETELRNLRHAQETLLSAGCYPPADVRKRIQAILEKLSITEEGEDKYKDPSSAFFVMDEINKEALRRFSMDEEEKK